MTVLRSSNLSLEIHQYCPSSSYHAVPADRRNKMLDWRQVTLNASSPTMSHALEQINAVRIGVICQTASSKLSVSCLHDNLHGYLCFYTENPTFCFCKAIFATPPIVLAVTIHTLPWKMRVESMSLVFLVWHPPWFFSFSGMVWRLPI